MSNSQFDSIGNVMSGATELVSGKAERLLEQLNPLVRARSVCLDLSPIQRIDAAGVAVLTKLYCAARETGHGFAVANLRPRVAEVLALVGLDKVLVSRKAVKNSPFGILTEPTAA